MAGPVLVFALSPNGLELRRNTCKPNRGRAQRAEVKAAGVVACSELLGAPCKGSLGLRLVLARLGARRSTSKEPRQLLEMAPRDASTWLVDTQPPQHGQAG